LDRGNLSRVKTLWKTSSISSEYWDSHKARFSCVLMVLMQWGSTIFWETVGKNERRFSPSKHLKNTDHPRRLVTNVGTFLHNSYHLILKALSGVCLPASLKQFCLRLLLILCFESPWRDSVNNVDLLLGIGVRYFFTFSESSYVRTTYFSVFTCSSLCFDLFILVLSLLAPILLALQHLRMHSVAWNQFPIAKFCWLIRLHHFCGDKLLEKRSLQLKKYLSLRDGIIEPSSSPWRAKVVIVQIENHTMRLCIDYSQTVHKFTLLETIVKCPRCE